MPAKQVLIIYYSQTGQLADIVNVFSKPLKTESINLEIVRINTHHNFDFPWTSEKFFNAMPESVLNIPSELESYSLKQEKYDLIIFAYQPWFLSPSIPANSLLSDPKFQKVLNGTPVITLIGARNMWLNSQEKIKEKLKTLNANLVGNVVLIDRHQNNISAFTILHWMLGGKKDRYLGFFPLPGISQKDIAASESFGSLLLPHIESGNWDGLQDKFIEVGAVEVKDDLMFIEHRAGRLFSIWANLAYGKKNRCTILIFYKYYLLIALFIVAPIVLIVNNLLFKHFFIKQVNRKKQYYLSIN
ncbi:MAG: hypothetical protein H7329_08910 [Opitutaceae bacterium]|nr:hypothetical protein [Cytophagales bacterium]